jgi:hypothetical protein
MTPALGAHPLAVPRQPGLRSCAAVLTRAPRATRALALPQEAPEMLSDRHVTHRNTPA